MGKRIRSKTAESNDDDDSDDDDDVDDVDDENTTDTNVLLSAFFKRHGLVKTTQISPWNEFYRFGMHAALKRTRREHVVLRKDNNSVARVEIFFERIHAEEKTKLYPEEALGMYNAHYVVPVVVHGRAVLYDETNVAMQTQAFVVPFIDLPVVVGSDACAAAAASSSSSPNNNIIPLHAEGGYVIVNGNAKVVLPQEQQALNQLLRLRVRNKWSLEMRSRADASGIMSKFVLAYSPATAEFRIRHSLLKKNSKLPLGILAMAMGIELPSHRAFSVERQRVVVALAAESSGTNMQKARFVLSNRLESTHAASRAKRMQEVENFLRIRLFPHCNGNYDASREQLSYIIDEAMACISEKRKPDNRDALMHKRYETCGRLFHEMFAGLLTRFLEDAISAMQDTLINKNKNLAHILETFETYFHGAQHSKTFSTCLATGKWKLPHSKSTRIDVTEELRLENPRSTLSHLRRTTGSATKQTQNIEPRKAHATHDGFVCVSETPESDKTGIAKNLATCALISEHRVLDPSVLKILHDARGTSRLIVNNNIQEIRVHGPTLRRLLVRLRRMGRIPYDVGISYDEIGDVLDVRSDEGRLVQAVIVVENGVARSQFLSSVDASRINWDEMIHAGIVEILDVQESFQRDVHVASSKSEITPLTTHLVMWPGSLFGAMGAMVPLPEMNQCTRLSYYTAMSKQATPATSIQTNWSTLQYALQTPQMPLVSSRLEYVMRGESESNRSEGNLDGVNVVAAIFVDERAQEDSIIIRQSFIDRGGMHTCVSHVYHHTIRAFEQGYNCNIEHGPKEMCNHEACSAFYNKNGIIKKRTLVTPGQILIAKKFWDETQQKYIDSSIRIPEHDVTSETLKFNMTVTKIKRKKDSISIKTTVYRTPMVGDKYAQRSGQKGTVGAIKQDVDMPRTSEGIIPDIVINCQSFPSRQTPSYFAEAQKAKLAAIHGQRADATPFESTIDAYDLAQALFDAGYPRDGTERLYNGETGELIQNTATVGVVYEHQLKHFAERKCYARRSGRVDPVTGEPCKGRKHGGGMRNGVMETDTYNAHGAVNGVLMDRTRDSGAPMDANVCDACGNFVFEPRCSCGANATRKTKVRTKRPFVVAFQELTGLCAKIRMRTD